MGSWCFLFVLFNRIRISNIETSNRLARNYWNDSQPATANNNALFALHLTAEANNVSKDPNLSENLLISVNPFLTNLSLENILPHDDELQEAVYSPDGKRISTISENNMFLLWDTQTGRQHNLPMRDEDSISSVSFSPDWKWIVIGSKDNTLRLWDVENGRQIGAAIQLAGEVTSIRFSPDEDKRKTTD